jgi:hypothetical protein
LPVGSEDGFLLEEQWLEGSNHSTLIAKQSPANTPTATGLYLIVTGPNSKSWSYRYWKDGKERWHGIGSLNDVSLKDARLARDAARLRVKGDRSTAGVDIVQEKRKAREEAKAVEARVVLPTFEECAEAYIRTNWSAWSEKHRNQWPSSLKRYVYPLLQTRADNFM